MTNKDGSLTRRARHDVRHKNIKIYSEMNKGSSSWVFCSIEKDGLQVDHPCIRGRIFLVLTSESIQTVLSVGVLANKSS